MHFSYRRFCWSVGTTSFRMADFNIQIERQLDLLQKFWELPENMDANWQKNNVLQTSYYDFLKDEGFVVQDAPRPYKDARQKTSGLVNIGLIDNDRKLTDAGHALLSIVRTGAFHSDNLLQISADSFLYLKQLLKTYDDVDGDIVRPFLVVLYAILKLKHLSYEEFTYLLPLCTNQRNTGEIVKAIEQLRRGKACIDDIILMRLLSMRNYNEALEFFLAHNVTEETLTAVGMNRKSRNYDKAYFPFYDLLYKVVFEKDDKSMPILYNAVSKLGTNLQVLWRQFLFKSTVKQKNNKEGTKNLKMSPLTEAKTDMEFKRLFFEQMHIFKAKATLGDYFDLNMRYFKTTGAVIFADNKVILDVLPHCWLFAVQEELLTLAYSKSSNLGKDVPFASIAKFLDINEQVLFCNLEKLYGILAKNATDAKYAISNERLQRFNSLIDSKFCRKTLISILEKIEKQEYDEVHQAVTHDANIPTIFEYVIGIAWFLISDRQGDILNYMKLSLEADLLPRSHAAGGNADIEYVYEETTCQPAHTLLIEATLSESTNQRRMEMEPVSRHLGEHILSCNDKKAYSLFISNHIHHNVLSDFRNRRLYEYYDSSFEKKVDGLKIISLETSELRLILEKEINYCRLYGIFDEAYNSDAPIPLWYNKTIKTPLTGG